MSADKLETDALKAWLDSLGRSDSTGVDGQACDWRETVLRSLFKPAASANSRVATNANVETAPVSPPQKPKR